jgi:molybdopterin synthase sulfur carrier subunit
MIKVLFFASIRERLGLSELSLALPAEAQNLSAFSQYLIAQHEPWWGEVLLADNVLTAVNQAVVSCDVMLSEGDELAFFPPVTGG